MTFARAAAGRRARFTGAMAQVEDFRWTIGDRSVRWRCAGQEISKDFCDEVPSAVVLRDESGVAVVGPESALGVDNAVIYNADGSERSRVTPPQPDRHVVFAQMYYVADELTAVAITTGNEWATVVDSETGQATRTYETR